MCDWDTRRRSGENKRSKKRQFFDPFLQTGFLAVWPPGRNEGVAYVRNAVFSQILDHESSWTLYETFNVIRKEAADIISVAPRMTWGGYGNEKGDKMPFEGPFLRVPDGAGLGVALDRQKNDR